MIVGWSTPDGRAGGYRGVREARESGLWFLYILFFFPYFGLLASEGARGCLSILERPGEADTESADE